MTVISTSDNKQRLPDSTPPRFVAHALDIVREKIFTRRVARSALNGQECLGSGESDLIRGPHGEDVQIVAESVLINSKLGFASANLGSGNLGSGNLAGGSSSWGMIRRSPGWQAAALFGFSGRSASPAPAGCGDDLLLGDYLVSDVNEAKLESA